MTSQLQIGRIKACDNIGQKNQINRLVNIKYINKTDFILVLTMHYSLYTYKVFAISVYILGKSFILK